MFVSAIKQRGQLGSCHPCNTYSTRLSVLAQVNLRENNQVNLRENNLRENNQVRTQEQLNAKR